MKRIIKCSNNDGMAITFGSSFSPYLLANCDGIYTVKNKVSTSDNTMIDGATYQGMVTSKRNIVLTLIEKDEHQTNRYQLYSLFKPKTKGTFTYKEDYEDEYTTERTIDYWVESIDITSRGNARTATVSLICPDPFFEAPNDITVVMAGWKSGFHFVHEFLEGGEEFGTRIVEKLKTIDNETGAEGIGITISIEATGAVTDPIIRHVEADEYIRIGTAAHPLSMVNGDKLVITTGTNNKHVYFTHNQVTNEINEYLDEGSEFIQLQSGPNTIGYDAVSGSDNMIVSLTYRYKYLGV